MSLATTGSGGSLFAIRHSLSSLISGRDQSRSVSPGRCPPIPWTKTTPIRAGSPGGSAEGAGAAAVALRRAGFAGGSGGAARWYCCGAPGAMIVIDDLLPEDAPAAGSSRPRIVPGGHPVTRVAGTGGAGLVGRRDPPPGSILRE